MKDAPNKQKSVLLLAEWLDPRLERGVARYAKQANWHLNLDFAYSRDLQIEGWQGDGCIAMAGRPAIAEALKKLNAPVVDMTHQTDETYARIHEDDCAIGRMAADYFLKLGFKNFACYKTDNYPVASMRNQSFAARVAEAGHSSTNLLWRYQTRGTLSSWVQHMTWITSQLEKLPKPLAVFCIDDRGALNIIDACSSSRIEIPDAVSVLGVGNLEMACQCAAIPLSSIQIDVEALGFQAAEILDRIMAGETPPSKPILLEPLGVEERQSTHTLAVNDPCGQQVIRFLLDNYRSPIDIQDVARACEITRRQLTYITKKELNTNPAQLLENIRIKKACELLMTTRFKVERVAIEAGLGNALRLQRIFRRRFNTSPAVWRKQQCAEAIRATHSELPKVQAKASHRDSAGSHIT